MYGEHNKASIHAKCVMLAAHAMLKRSTQEINSTTITNSYHVPQLPLPPVFQAHSEVWFLRSQLIWFERPVPVLPPEKLSFSQRLPRSAPVKVKPPQHNSVQRPFKGNELRSTWSLQQLLRASAPQIREWVNSFFYQEEMKICMKITWIGVVPFSVSKANYTEFNSEIKLLFFSCCFLF